MFGLICFLWVLSCGFAGLSFVYGRSACRHKKRAELYRKQIEELQIESAKVVSYECKSKPTTKQ